MLNEHIVTIDPLGAPTAEQRAEAKAKTAPMDKFIVGVVTTLAGVVLMLAGVYIGTKDPDLWNQLPGVVEPSGERAEPEYVPGPTLERK